MLISTMTIKEMRENARKTYLNMFNADKNFNDLLKSKNNEEDDNNDNKNEKKFDDNEDDLDELLI